MDECKKIELIRTNLLRRGSGKDENDCIRVITQYWTLDGVLLFEFDPLKNPEPQL
jgi:hypothetical protein